MTSPFSLRGVVEGFYGVYYTHPERLDLIRFLGDHGFNLYIYAPKNDRQHRNRWREPYPEFVMARFAEAVQVANESGVEFCYALSPGVSICYSSEEDFQRVVDKLAAFYRLGVRSFSLLMDDMTSEFRFPADAARFPDFAAAHVDLCNRVHDRLKELDSRCSLSMCPTDYYGVAPFSRYLHELGAGIHPEIDIFYTGRSICSAEITAPEAAAFADAVGRVPILWDNYPVNDLAMRPELHLGPIRGRDAALPGAFKGFVAVPMIEAEASKIPLLTLADYLADPVGYRPDESWPRAIAEIAGSESREACTLLAENSLHSCLGTPEAPLLQSLVSQALAALRAGRGVNDPKVYALEGYLACLDEACDHLKNRMGNLALRNNLLPWIELLEYGTWSGQRALAVLRSLEKSAAYDVDYRFMLEYRTAAEKHHKRIAGRILLPLAEYVDEQIAAHPEVRDRP